MKVSQPSLTEVAAKDTEYGNAIAALSEIMAHQVVESMEVKVRSTLVAKNAKNMLLDSDSSSLPDQPYGVSQMIGIGGAGVIFRKGKYRALKVSSTSYSCLVDASHPDNPATCGKLILRRWFEGPRAHHPNVVHYNSMVIVPRDQLSQVVDPSILQILEEQHRRRQAEGAVQQFDAVVLVEMPLASCGDLEKHTLNQFSCWPNFTGCSAAEEALRRKLLRGKKFGTAILDYPLTCQLYVGLMDGMEFLHGSSIVVGDFKPGNVLLDEAPGGVLTALIADIETSKQADACGVAKGITYCTEMMRPHDWHLVTKDGSLANQAHDVFGLYLSALMSLVDVRTVIQHFWAEATAASDVTDIIASVKPLLLLLRMLAYAPSDQALDMILPGNSEDVPEYCYRIAKDVFDLSNCKHHFKDSSAADLLYTHGRPTAFQQVLAGLHGLLSVNKEAAWFLLMTAEGMIERPPISELSKKYRAHLMSSMTNKGMNSGLIPVHIEGSVLGQLQGLRTAVQRSPASLIQLGQTGLVDIPYRCMVLEDVYEAAMRSNAIELTNIGLDEHNNFTQSPEPVSAARLFLRLQDMFTTNPQLVWDFPQQNKEAMSDQLYQLILGPKDVLLEWTQMHPEYCLKQNVSQGEHTKTEQTEQMGAIGRGVPGSSAIAPSGNMPVVLATTGGDVSVSRGVRKHDTAACIEEQAGATETRGVLVVSEEIAPCGDRLMESVAASTDNLAQALNNLPFQNTADCAEEQMTANETRDVLVVSEELAPCGDRLMELVAASADNLAQALNDLPTQNTADNIEEQLTSAVTRDVLLAAKQTALCGDKLMESAAEFADKLAEASDGLLVQKAAACSGLLVETKAACTGMAVETADVHSDMSVDATVTGVDVPANACNRMLALPGSACHDISQKISCGNMAIHIGTCLSDDLALLYATGSRSDDSTSSFTTTPSTTATLISHSSDAAPTELVEQHSVLSNSSQDHKEVANNKPGMPEKDNKKKSKKHVVRKALGWGLKFLDRMLTAAVGAQPTHFVNDHNPMSVFLPTVTCRFVV